MRKKNKIKKNSNTKKDDAVFLFIGFGCREGISYEETISFLRFME